MLHGLRENTSKGDIPIGEPQNISRAPSALFIGRMIKQITVKNEKPEQEVNIMNVTQEPRHTVSELTRLNRATSKNENFHRSDGRAAGVAFQRLAGNGVIQAMTPR
jgi:hypothetical protein